MWWFIVTDGLLFAGFLASYGYARILAFTWPDQAEVFSLKYIAAMTFVLISSSATMASAVHAMAENRRRDALKYVVLTMIGGIVFLGMQAYEWSHLIGEGARLARNPWGDASFGAYFFLLTGFHGSHVLTGVIVLVSTAIRLAGNRSTKDGVEMAGLYLAFRRSRLGLHLYVVLFAVVQAFRPAVVVSCAVTGSPGACFSCSPS